MKYTDRISDYLLSDRKGKAANRLEREALNDPFLYEALEGLTEVKGDHLKAITCLDRKLRKRVGKYVGIGLKGWMTVAAVVVLSILSWIFIPVKQAGMQMAKVETPEEQHEPDMDSASPKIRGRMAKAVAVMADSLKQDQRQVEPVMLADAPDKRKELVVIINAVNNQKALPVEGVKKFERYIEESLRYPEDALMERLQGDIKLSFIINENGRPSRIKVVEWISYSCNREAIRLVDEGPVWNYTGSDEPTYVVISFRLGK